MFFAPVANSQNSEIHEPAPNRTNWAIRFDVGPNYSFIPNQKQLTSDFNILPELSVYYKRFFLNISYRYSDFELIDNNYDVYRGLRRFGYIYKAGINFDIYKSINADVCIGILEDKEQDWFVNHRFKEYYKHTPFAGFKINRDFYLNYVRQIIVGIGAEYYPGIGQLETGIFEYGNINFRLTVGYKRWITRQNKP
ncbi:hypothetical protein ACE1ET_07715 [Saccharicrinis sp. FJH62]|uniref:hypothetical protein n=1 Tax=Saccharicrinis sp. FJH62 TaxID=3344657 RepID=UPI0035D44088